MSWRTVATALIVVFVIVLLQSVLIGPTVEITESLNQTGDYSNEYFDGNSLIPGFVESWINMGLVAIFGMMLWAVARVLRRELTRGGGL